MYIYKHNPESGNMTYMLLVVAVIGFLMIEVVLAVSKLAYASLRVNHAAQSAALAGAVAYQKSMVTEAEKRHQEIIDAMPIPPIPDPCNPESLFTPADKDAIRAAAKKASVKAMSTVITANGAEVEGDPVVKDDKEVIVKAKITYQPPFKGLGFKDDIVRTGKAKVIYKLKEPDVNPICSP